MRKNNYPWSKGVGAAFALLSAVLLYIAYRICHEWVLLLFSIGALVCGIPMLSYEGQKRLHYVYSEVAGHLEAGTPPENYDKIIWIATVEIFGFLWLIFPVIVAFCDDLWKYIAFPIVTAVICTAFINEWVYTFIGWGKKYVAIQLSANFILLAAAIMYRFTALDVI